MSNKYYDVLWVDKKASSEEIKKAYRKKAMEYHPDRAKWDKKVAETKFKEIGEAYDTLSDSSKRKNYDTFGSAKSNPFWGGSSYSSWWTWGFEDMFWWGWQSSGWFGWGWFDFNMEDLFGWWTSRQQTRQEPKKEKKPETLDFEKTYELPIFDFILGWSLEIKWVYGQLKTIKVPAWTKPGTKMRVKWFGKKESGRTDWNLLVKIDAKMPKYISDMDKQMLERIGEGIGY